MLVEQRLVDAVGDAALPPPDEIVRPVRACASAAAVGVVGAGTGVHPGRADFCMYVCLTREIIGATAVRNIVREGGKRGERREERKGI